MAERVGFEPTVPAKVRRFSRPFRYNHFGISPFGAREMLSHFELNVNSNNEIYNKNKNLFFLTL